MNHPAYTTGTLCRTLSADHNTMINALNSLYSFIPPTLSTKELFLNFGGSRPFLMEDFIALPIPQKNFVQMLPLPLVLALVFFTRVGSSWRRQKTTCGSIVCHYMNVSHLFCTNNILITPTHPLSALQAPLIPLGYLWYPPRQVAAVMQVES